MALRGAWNFNEASGNAIDYGGLSVPLVPSGSALRVAARDGVGRAIARGSISGFGTTLIASGATAISVGARFMYDGGSGDRGVVTLLSGNASGERGGIFVNGNKVGFWLDLSSGFQVVQPNAALQSGRWYDVVAVWNGSTMRVWINGVLQAESTAATGTMPVVINGLTTTYNGAQTGDSGNGILIDQAWLWNHGASEEDVVMAAATEPGWTYNTANSRFPGAVHASGRYLLDTTGAPYFATLDSAWDLLHVNPNAARRKAYLSSRAAQGFNMAYVGLVRSDVDGSSNPVGLAGGVAPFSGATPSAWNLAAPNEAFWTQVDALLTAAEALGITLWLQPFTTWDASCHAVYTNATDAQVRAFGQWLGNRYKTRTNVVWLFGGDWGNPGATALSRAEQLILGIRDSGDTHHFALHMVEESDGHVVQAGTTGAWTASTTLADQETLRPTYTYNPTYYRNRVAYAATPAKPTFLIEANYEGNTRDSILTTAAVVRRQALWNLVSGGQAGHGYGHGRVFNFTGNADEQFSWITSLYTAATEQLRQLAARWRALSGWQNLVPDTGNTLVTGGRGTERTSFVVEHVTANDYAPAAITPNKALAVVYVPSARDMTLDLSKVGANASVWRVDPTGERADANMGAALGIPAGTFLTHADGSSDYLLIITATAPNEATPAITAGATIAATTQLSVSSPASVPAGVDVAVALGSVQNVQVALTAGVGVGALAVIPSAPVSTGAPVAAGVTVAVTAAKANEPQPGPANPTPGVVATAIVTPTVEQAAQLQAGVAIAAVTTKVNGDGVPVAYVKLEDGQVVGPCNVYVVFGGTAVGPVTLHYSGSGG